MRSFSPCHCCHNLLACICLCAYICLLPRIFCLACYRLCVVRLPAFHWDIKDIVCRTLAVLFIGSQSFPGYGQIFACWYDIQYSFDSSVSVWYLMLLNVFMVRISELECCFTNAVINFWFWIFFVWCDTCSLLWDITWSVTWDILCNTRKFLIQNVLSLVVRRTHILIRFGKVFIQNVFFSE